MGILSDNMKAGFRRAYNTLLLSRSLNPNPNLPSIFHKRSVFTSARRFTFPAASVPSLSVPSRYCAPVAPPAFHSSPPLQQQCEEGSRREQLQILEIRDVVKDIESIYCQMLAGLLIAKDPVFIPDIVQKSKRRTGYLKDLYKVLDEMLREQGPYSRYVGEWRAQTQIAISMIALAHWLETGSLLMPSEVEEKLGLRFSEFGLVIEDYLVGICFMSNLKPRDAVSQLTLGKYDATKVLSFLETVSGIFWEVNNLQRKKLDNFAGVDDHEDDEGSRSAK